MIIAKVTLLLLLAFGFSALLHKRSAAVRHLIWTLALAGSVIMMLAALVMPPLSIRVPAAVPAAADIVNRITPVKPADEATFPAQPPARAVRVEPAAQDPTSRAATRVRIDPVVLLPLLYFAGILTVMAWYVMGRIAVHRLAQEGSLVTDPEWLTLLARVKAGAGLIGPVRLIRSDRVGSPITWGLHQPVIVLPPEATDWNEERRRIVLAHEVAHAARGDHMARLIGVIAAAVYWFHPLVWAALRRQTRESERAADDHVLVRGTSGTAYAAHLLEIARRSRALRQTEMVAIGMARRSELEGRLMAVLDEQQERKAPPRRTAVLACTTVALVTLTGAAARPDLERYSPSTVELPVSAAAPIEAVLLSSLSVDSLIERTVDAKAGETLELDLETGGEITIQGWDRPQVRVRVRLAGSNWRETEVEIERTGGGVRVLAEPTRERGNFSTSHDFEIMVPLRYDVRLESAGGGITITGVEGEFRGSTGGGDMRLTRARGVARLTTGGGDIQVSDSDLEGRVGTGGGTVRFSAVKGGLRGSSGSGPVIYSDTGGERTGDLSKVEVSDKRISVSAGTSGVLHIRKAGGDIILDAAPEGLNGHTGGGEVRIGRSRGMVDVSTGGGDITIGPVSGSVRAGTGAGDVRITITEAAGRSQSVEVSAGVGEVVIDWPAGVPARFELETAYTNNFGRRTRINTDLNLDREETDRWDNDTGTPRRYVRASGQIGQGGGLVRVQTVNGDITIRTR